MKRLHAIAAMLILVAGSAQADVGSWDILAFPDHVINDVEFRVGSADSIFIAMATTSADTSGVWVSADGGATWNRSLDSGGTQIHAVTMDPDNPDYIWAGRDQASVSVSPSGGAGWQTIAGFGPANKVYDMSIPEGNNTVTGPYRVYFATLFGLYFTNDGGGSLDQMDDRSATTVRVCPNDPNVIWVGTNGFGVIYTDDGGATWSQWSGETFANKDRVRNLEINPNDCSQAVARVWAPNASDFIGYTDDAGATWTELDAEAGRGLLVHPLDEGKAILAGSLNNGMLYTSTDGAGFDVFSEGIVDQTQQFAMTPGTDDQVLAATRAGLAHMTVDLHPNAPENVTADCGTYPICGIDVHWDAVTTNADGSDADDVTGYVVFRDVPPFGDIDDTLATLGAILSYNDQDLDGVVAASYQVSAVDAVGLWSPSSDGSPAVVPILCECDSTGVAGDIPGVPGAAFTELRQNSPNPFNPRTAIDFVVGEAEAGARVQLAVYDTRGQVVRHLVNEERAMGTHRVTWDGTDDEGRAVASGVYFYRLDVGGIHETRSMVVVK